MMSPAEIDQLQAVLLQLARGIAAGLGHDPDDPDVALVITEQFGAAADAMTIGRYEREMGR